MSVTTRADDPCARECRTDATRRNRLLGGPHRRNHTEDPRLTEHSAGSFDDADNTISRFTEYLSSARLVKMAKFHSTPSARADRGPLPDPSAVASARADRKSVVQGKGGDRGR